MAIARSVAVKIAGVVVLLLVVVFVVARISSWSDAIQIDDTKKLQWRDLKAAEAVLKTAQVPTGWLAGVFVSNAAIEKVLNQQAGTVIEVIGQQGFEDLTVEVSKFDLVAQDGPALVTFDLIASSPKNNVKLALRAKGLLGYSRTAFVGEKQIPTGFLNLSITELKPKLTLWNAFSVSVPDFLKSASATVLMRSIGKGIEVPVPLKESLKFSLGDPPADDRPPMATKVKTLPIKDTGGSVTLAIRYKNTDLTYPLAFSLPLFTKGGIWLLAHDKAVPLPAVSDETPTDAQLSALSAEVGKLRAAIYTPSGEVAAFLAGRTLTSLVNLFSSLSEDQRSVVAQSTAIDKELFNKEWRDDILGKGGFKITGQNANFATAKAVIGAPTATWVPSTGVAITAGVAADGVVGLHWHFDPMLGGGVGANLNVHLSGSTPINAKLGVAMEKLDGKPVALLVPVVDCANVPLQGEENGELKVKVRMGQLLFDKPMAPQAIVDSVPRRVDLPIVKREDLEKTLKKNEVGTIPHWVNNALDITLDPVAAKASNDGFWIESRVAVAPAAKDPAGAKAQKVALDKSVREYTDKLPAPKCPEASSLEVEILGVKIGKNGELVKLFMAGGALVGQATEAAKKALNDAGVALGSAAQSVGDGIKHLGNEIGKEAKKICGDFCP